MDVYNNIANSLYKVTDLGSFKAYSYFTTKDRFDSNKSSYKIYYTDGKIEDSGKSSVFGAHMLDKQSDELIITQGEESCIALKILDITLDVVGSPKLNNFDWLANSMKLINKYSKLIVLGDNDWQLEIYRRLNGTHEILTIDNSQLNGFCSVFDAYAHNSSSNIVEAIGKPIKLEIDGILTVDDMKFIDWSNIDRIYTGFNDIDSKSLGLPMMFTSLWTGKTGQGKTTVVNKLVLNAMQQNFRVCIYSGEMSADRVYTDIGTQACKSSDITNTPIKLWDGTPSGEYYSCVNIYAQERFRNWSKNRLFIKNNDFVKDNEADNIVNIFENAFKMHNCRLFVVDNLMSILAKNVNDNPNEIQTYLMNRLVEFAVRCNVHVIVVAHPRKTRAGESLGNDDVAGTSNVPNMAGAVYAVKRLDQEELKKVEKYCEENRCDPWSGTISCIKNRATGKLFKIKTRWDNDTRQVYGFGDKVIEYAMYDDKYAMKEVNCDN